ncbi:MAG: tRNA (adenosine(37)-N6)-dimethylallyltransferase MiaA [Gammaproteobacteria bacterium]|nr:MAG: tRNA (adenosine(37)-N6)-dimethylallyltransferase MiaA [Gammaproteobacteria bacterium]
MKVLLLKGPTAVGKTALATALFDNMPISLISVDSAQIYQDMDIGTGKPSQEFLKKYPHSLIDIITPNISYNVANFIKDVNVLIKKAINEKKYPVLVGGSSLYFNALQQGLSDLPPADKQIRQFIENKAKQKGWSKLHQDLIKVDKEAGIRIKPQDCQRIMRALEVYYLTGNSITNLQNNRKKLNHDWVSVCLFPTDRKILHTNINNRFKKMIKDGLIDETKYIIKKYNLNSSNSSLHCIGYKQTYDYLQNKTNLDDLTQKACAATRQMAKRQLTWLRHEQDIVRINSEYSIQEQLKILQKIVNTSR